MRPLLCPPALLLATTVASAQAPAPSGLVIGIHGTQTTQHPEGRDPTPMGGGRLHVGYAPSSYLALFAEVPVSILARGEEYANGAYFRATSNAVLSGADLGIRLLAPLGRAPFTPYLTAATGVRAATQTLIVQDTVFYRDGRPAGVIGDTTRATTSGSTASAGGGLLVRLSRTLSLDAAVTVGRGRYTRMAVESTTDGRAAVNIPEDRYQVRAASVGLTWFPGAARR